MWKGKDSQLLAIGTAHISARSIEDVDQAFSLYQPDIVAVELCAPRHEALMTPKNWRHLDIAQVIRQKKIWLLCSSLILSAFQKKMSKATGVQPGMEMKTALQLAKKNKCEILLADREVRTTLARAWSQIGFFSRLWLGSFLVSSLFVPEPVREEDIEELKTKDVLEDIMRALPKRYKSLKDVILTERDICISEKIREKLKKETKLSQQSKARKPYKKAPKKMLAVLGAAHLKGVERNLKKKSNSNWQSLLQLPPKRIFKNIISWVIFGIVCMGFSAIFFRGDLSIAGLQDVLLAWTLSRSIGAGVGALITYPNAITAFVTIALAPVSYFLGFAGIRLWMISALLELRFCKPQVEDFENIVKDTESFRGFGRALYSNRVMHLIFLILGVSFGLTIGNLVFFHFILTDVFHIY